jgi:hypothetical protein
LEVVKLLVHAGADMEKQDQVSAVWHDSAISFSVSNLCAALQYLAREHSADMGSLQWAPGGDESAGGGKGRRGEAE